MIENDKNKKEAQATGASFVLLFIHYRRSCSELAHLALQLPNSLLVLDCSWSVIIPLSFLYQSRTSSILLPPLQHSKQPNSHRSCKRHRPFQDCLERDSLLHSFAVLLHARCQDWRCLPDGCALRRRDQDSVQAKHLQNMKEWACPLMPQGVNTSSQVYVFPESDPVPFSFYLFPPFTVYKRKGFATNVPWGPPGAIEFGRDVRFRYPESDAEIDDW